MAAPGDTTNPTAAARTAARAAALAGPPLEGAVALVEQRLAALGAALAQHDSTRIERQADRAIDVLMPREGPGLYSAAGPAERTRGAASISA